MTDYFNLYGPPGSGKTRRLIQIAQAAIRKYGTDRVAFCTFTKTAADEARERAATALGITGSDKAIRTRLPYFGTIHSLAYRLCGVSQDQMLTTKKVVAFCEDQHIAKPKGKGDDYEPDTPYYELPTNPEQIDLVRLLLSTAAHRMIDLESAIRYLPQEDVSKHGPARLLWLAQQLRDWKRDQNIYDFDDLLHLGRHERLPVTVLICDEAQDNSPLLWDVLDRWAAQSVEKMIVGGDFYQCQPGDTLVRTSTGYVPMRDLNPTKHRLLSYEKLHRDVYGHKTGGYSFELSHRFYTGLMFTVHAGKRKSRCTPNHKWPFKWTSKATDLNVVYLMRQGDRWRVGWCQLFRKDGLFHLGFRARGEKADGAWILKVFTNKTDASLYESLVSIKYGITTLPFEPVFGATYLTKDALDKFYGLLDPKQQVTAAAHCLAVHDRYIDYPLYDPKLPYARLGKTTQGIVYACNLMPELMAVPQVTDDEKTATWESVRITSEWVDSELVYSINVEPYHTYLADGLVTHNSIFAFMGADPDLFLKRPGPWQTIGDSYRFGPKTATYCRDILIDGFGDDAGQKVDTWQGVGGQPQDGTFLKLARTNKLLDHFKRLLREDGEPYRQFRGRAPLQTKAAEAYTTLWYLLNRRDVALSDVLNVSKQLPKNYLERGVPAALERSAKGAPGMLVYASDAERVLGGMDLRRVQTVLPYADYFDAVLRRYGLRGLVQEPRTIVSTVHGAKGREADRVEAARSWAILPGRALSDSTASRAECCVAYVMCSRHRIELRIIDIPGDRGIPYPLPGSLVVE